MITEVLSASFSGLFVLISLFAPGWLLGRALRLKGGIIEAFLGSAGILMNSLLVLDTLGISFSRAHIASIIVLICGALALMGNLPKVSLGRSARETHYSSLLKLPYFFLAPAAIGLIAIVIKASLDPLSGFDTAFRWDFLARQMLRTGTLHFYPPVSSEDFVQYSWCDGIAPLISSLYFFAYSNFECESAIITTPIVILQALLLFGTVYRLGERRGGFVVGCAATGLLASSCVLLWGIALGQETAFTALSLAGMYLFIERSRDAPNSNHLVWAGIAAGSGALAREYGLIFVVLGGLAILADRPSGRKWLQFLLAAAVVAAPWYLRNWIKTGNPIYGHEFAGLFQSNPVNAEYFRLIKELMGIGTAELPIGGLLHLIFRLLAAPLFLGLAGLFPLRSETKYLLQGVACTVALWFWSIGLTSGGAIYSLRVLTPALALGAVLAAPYVTRYAVGRRYWLVGLALTLLAVDSAERSLFMPNDPFVSWWSVRPSAWLQFRAAVQHWNENPYYTEIVDVAGDKKMLVTDPLMHAIFSKLGAKPVPIFSPEVRMLFEDNINFAGCVAQLRSAGFRFVLLSRQRDIGQSLISRHRFFQELRLRPLASDTALFDIYDLYSPDLIAPVSKTRASL